LLMFIRNFILLSDFFIKVQKKNQTYTPYTCPHPKDEARVGKCKSYTGDGSGNTPEPLNQSSHDESSDNPFLKRFKLLANRFEDWSNWIDLLKSFSPDEYKSVNLESNHANTIKLAVELALLNIFDENSKNYKRKGSDQDLFSLIFSWLLNFQIGMYVEWVLASLLETKEAKTKFQRLFSSYQLRHWPFINKNRPITEYSIYPTQIFFDKTNLIKLVRLIMGSYHTSFWESLTPRQKYFFLKEIIRLSRTYGSYDYINALLDDKQNFSFCEDSKEIKILNQTFRLDHIN
jgi:hypothetical protein